MSIFHMRKENKKKFIYHKSLLDNLRSLKKFHNRKIRQNTCNPLKILLALLEKVRNTTNPIEIRSVGGWYMGFMKGYAGISVIITFYSFVVELLNQITPEQFHFSIPLFLLLLPLLLSLWAIPAVLLFELTREKRRKFIWKWANKLDITKDLNMEKIQK